MTQRNSRPALFTAQNVRALLAGTKTQTRRQMSVQPHDGAEVVCDDFYPTVIAKNGDEEPGPEVFGAWWSDGEEALRCPYGRPGDHLWVRETWARDSEDGAVFYRADVGSGNGADEWQHNIDVGASGYRWRPSIFMPRAASRITLEVTVVRAERLQAISEADAISEGCVASPFPGPWWQGYRGIGDGDLIHQQGIGDTPPAWMIEPKRMRDHSGLGLSARDAYRALWIQINSLESWDANPWVWVVEFRRSSNLQPNGANEGQQNVAPLN